MSFSLDFCDTNKKFHPEIWKSLLKLQFSEQFSCPVSRDIFEVGRIVIGFWYKIIHMSLVAPKKGMAILWKYSPRNVCFLRIFTRTKNTETSDSAEI